MEMHQEDVVKKNAGMVRAYWLEDVRGFPVVGTVEQRTEGNPDHGASWYSDRSKLGGLGSGAVGAARQDWQHPHAFLHKSTKLRKSIHSRAARCPVQHIVRRVQRFSMLEFPGCIE